MMLVVFAGWHPTPASATTFYVDPALGDDGELGDSPATPWRTLARVASEDLAPGDAVLLRRGSVWNEALYVWQNGTPAQRVVVASYGPATSAAPMLTGSPTCARIDGNYVTVKDVNAKACGVKGFSLAGDHDTLTSVRATRSAIGIEVGGEADFATVDHSEIANNRKMITLTKEHKNDDTGAFGVLLLGTRATVVGNRISGHTAFSYDYGRDGSAVEIYNSRGNDVYGNVASDNNTFVELGGAKSSDNWIHRNRVRSRLRRSFGLVTRGARDKNFGPVFRTRFTRNYVRLNGAHSFGFTCGLGCTRAIAIITGNVFRVNGVGGYTDGTPVLRHNRFIGGKLEVKR